MHALPPDQGPRTKDPTVYHNMHPFMTGIDTLCGEHAEWLRGRRVALVSHSAAVDVRGCPAAERVRRVAGCTLAALMGPEHGFLGARAAGAECPAEFHPHYGIPIHSLYGDTRKPTAAMLQDVDTLVVDLQDLGTRCYTYVSTLQYVLESAAEQGREVLVADRPVPLPSTIDGPLTVADCRSFVSLAPLPLCYGMTPGETAQWLVGELGLDVSLRVARMRGYGREPQRRPGWPPWIPPSPAMLSWESAQCYAATVWGEAIGGLDYGRGTVLPFQVLGADWMNGRELAAAMDAAGLPGVVFHAHRYVPAAPGAAAVVDGVRLVVIDPHAFQPARTAVALLECVQRLHGRDVLWNASTRPRFFDQLFGTPKVREGLEAGMPAGRIAQAWTTELSDFARSRQACLLYEAT
jgi:uncharacterized protein YbbC (DUF1343 family)